MRNEYKRSDIFRCTHESHHGFGNVVSVYHVLKEKKCYPNGCIYFKWMCRKLNKGVPCPKSFKHVGRKCPSCPDYYDEKIIKRPHLLLNKKEYQDFLNDLENFQIWLHSKNNKEVECAGTIKSVKPRFIMAPHNQRFNLLLKGFLILFKEGFIDLTFFEDSFYAILSPLQQNRFQLGEGDKIEIRATLRIDRGRLILHRVRRVEVEEKTSLTFWTIREAKEALLCSTLLDDQSEKCLLCLHSCLVDIDDSDTGELRSTSHGQRRRKLLCLKGVSTPEYCIVQAQEELCPIDYCQGEGIQQFS